MFQSEAPSPFRIGEGGLSAPSEETEQGDMTTHPGPNPERH